MVCARRVPFRNDERARFASDVLFCDGLPTVRNYKARGGPGGWATCGGAEQDPQRAANDSACPYTCAEGPDAACHPAVGWPLTFRYASGHVQVLQEGEENSALFKALFLTRLPAELRLHLEAVEAAPLKQLALRADQLWMTLVAKQQVLLTAQLPAEEMPALPVEDCEVAAMQKKFGGKRKDKKLPQTAVDGGQATAAAGNQSGQVAKKMVAMQLCWRHAKCGGQAGAPIWRIASGREVKAPAGGIFFKQPFLFLLWE
jgi:hypothetical protein